MPSFLVQFAQFHEEFRLPELLALAKLENVDIKYEPDNYKLNNPFFKVELDSVQDAQKLVKRAILIKHILNFGVKDPPMKSFMHKSKRRQIVGTNT
ncbi:unnamed protein product [Rhizopus microsporus]